MIIFALGLIPWLIILAASVLIIVATEIDSGKLSAVSLAVGAALLVWLTGTNPLPWITSHGWTIALSIVGYFVAGIAWGFFKWYLFNIDIRDKKKNGARNFGFKIPLQPSQHKSRIVGWMTFWPWSVIWFILNDPVRRAWNAIYERITGKLEAVSKHVFKDVSMPKKIFINGQEYEYDQNTISYDEIVALTRSDLGGWQGRNVVLSITYRKGTSEKPSGILAPGMTVPLVEGMTFSAAHTNNA